MSRNSGRTKIFLVFLILFLLSSALALTGVAYYLTRPADPLGGERIVIIPEGATLRQVAAGLQDKAIIRSRPAFLLLARLKKKGRSIKAGEYALSASMSPVDILKILSEGRVITHAVTIPEGYSREQIADLLAQKDLVKRGEFLSLTAGPQTLKLLGVSAPTLEGYLYPDTYRLSRGLTAATVVQILVRRFWEIITPLQERIDQLDMSLHDIVTLASIVEKETALAAERPLIASVFLNRLQRGMRLQSDPTVIYGLQNFDGNLTRRHLQAKTPYNTYVIGGLPPGPIANPGREAIEAVLFPAETDYLYFVSRNDGSHEFSETLREHNRAVRKFQKSSGQGRKNMP
jgi:UPF0755 protein